jgi:hypothetical protein
MIWMGDFSAARAFWQEPSGPVMGYHARMLETPFSKYAIADRPIASDQSSSG